MTLGAIDVPQIYAYSAISTYLTMREYEEANSKLLSQVVVVDCVEHNTELKDRLHSTSSGFLEQQL